MNYELYIKSRTRVGLSWKILYIHFIISIVYLVSNRSTTMDPFNYLDWSRIYILYRLWAISFSALHTSNPSEYTRCTEYSNIFQIPYLRRVPQSIQLVPLLSLLSSIFVRLSHTSLIYAREAGNINSNRFVPSRGRAESSLPLSLFSYYASLLSSRSAWNRGFVWSMH